MGRVSFFLGVVVLAGSLAAASRAHAQSATRAKPAAAPAPADDDWKKHVALSVELGPGGVLAAYTPDPGPSDLLFMTGVRAGYDLAPQWAGSLVLRQWWLPGNDHAFMFGPGARYEPVELPFGRVFVDGALGLVSTKHAWTFGLELGGGFEWDVPDAPVLSLGPFLRFGYVANPNHSTNDDGAAWAVGASITYHFGRGGNVASTTAGPKKRGPMKVTLTDTDRDGISDESDECPSVPQGKHPDQFRVGCPEPDSDEDGVPDTEDPCPHEPSGEIPDPHRIGCPINDEDGDGIPDSEDACPAKKGVSSQDPVLNGCPGKKPPKVEEPPPPPEDLKGINPSKRKKLNK